MTLQTPSAPTPTPPTSPTTPTPSPTQATPSAPPSAPRGSTGGLGLGSPELLSELKKPHTLKTRPAHKAMTIIFSGKGRVPSSEGQGVAGGPQD
ncbi:lysine-rich arabinogalactan protein 17-like isoform X2 [Denticeps clupeoides]|uniref:lysine-rich arabinogalactan protein 17-like isoform X2 n=2 Tax=Denticeps clupeoides TaxID=299321 RepID=UPI0010A578DD|nr:lysine-rich arabinogalactan protein 17-like isoform X2 [Denticeps clupeoides]